MSVVLLSAWTTVSFNISFPHLSLSLSLSLVPTHTFLISPLPPLSLRRYLFSGSFDATVSIWDIGVPGREAFAQVVGRLVGHESKVKAVAWHAASRTVLSGGDDYKLIAWNTKSGQPQRTQAFSLFSSSLSLFSSLFTHGFLSLWGLFWLLNLNSVSLSLIFLLSLSSRHA